MPAPKLLIAASTLFAMTGTAVAQDTNALINDTFAVLNQETKSHVDANTCIDDAIQNFIKSWLAEPILYPNGIVHKNAMNDLVATCGSYGGTIEPSFRALANGIQMVNHGRGMIEVKPIGDRSIAYTPA